MNYRIDQRRDVILANLLASPTSFPALLPHDQLLKEIRFNRASRLRGFLEGPLTFQPTYKYDRRSSTYDSSEKARAPAWCDRILWRSRVPDRVKQISYRRYEVDLSDHRPVSAAFEVVVKRIRRDLREKVREGVVQRWGEEQERVMRVLNDFYQN